YLNRKNQSGYEQSFKIYECEDCSNCPLKPQCTKAKGNRQIHWNPIYEEMKAKAKSALECAEKAAIYAQRKVEVESVFGHIKGNRSFRRFSLRGLNKVHVEFGLIALAHNILKVAGIRQLLSDKSQEKYKRQVEKKQIFLPLACFFRTYQTAPFNLCFFPFSILFLKHNFFIFDRIWQRVGRDEMIIVFQNETDILSFFHIRLKLFQRQLQIDTVVDDQIASRRQQNRQFLVGIWACHRRFFFHPQFFIVDRKYVIGDFFPKRRIYMLLPVYIKFKINFAQLFANAQVDQFHARIV